MKYIIWLLLILSSDLKSQENWVKIEKDKKIIIATEGAFAPFNFFKGQKLTGFEVELAESLAQELKLAYEWRTLPFDGLIIGLNMDRFQLVIASHGITEERAKSVDFTAPHYCTGGIILSREPMNIPHLESKVIGVQVGTTYFQKIKEIKGIKEVKTFPKDTDALMALKSKKIDAMITDKFVALKILETHKDLHLGDLIFTEQIAMAVKKGNNQLLMKVNEALKNIKIKGKYKEISLKYFNEDISCKDIAP